MQIYEANANVFVVARNLFVVPEETREVNHKWPDVIVVTASYSTSGNNLKQTLDFLIEVLQSLWNISEKHFFEQSPVGKLCLHFRQGRYEHSTSGSFEHEETRSSTELPRFQWSSSRRILEARLAVNS